MPSSASSASRRRLKRRGAGECGGGSGARPADALGARRAAHRRALGQRRALAPGQRQRLDLGVVVGHRGVGHRRGILLAGPDGTAAGALRGGAAAFLGGAGH